MMPTEIRGKRNREYTRADFARVCPEDWRDDFGAWFTLERSPSPQVVLTVKLSPRPSYDQFALFLTVWPFAFFEEPGRELERSQRITERPSGIAAADEVPDDGWPTPLRTRYSEPGRRKKIYERGRKEGGDMARWSCAILMLGVALGCGPATPSGAVREGAVQWHLSSSTSGALGPTALAPRVLLGATAQVVVPYDRLLKGDGKPVEVEALDELVQHREQVAALYADAERRDPRAERVVRELEGQYWHYGRLSAQMAVTPFCLMAPELVPGCRPNRVVVESLEGSPGGEKLWAVACEGYEARLRELEKERGLTEATLNLLMAGMVWNKGLGRVAAGEGEGGLGKSAGMKKGRAGGKVGEVRLDLMAMLEESGLAPEVLEAKLAEADASTAGMRLPADVAVLERMRPLVERPPPGISASHPLWREYTTYFDRRLAELKGAPRVTPGKRPVQPPRSWDSYRQLREDFARGLEYEFTRAEILRAQARLPPGKRLWLKAFRRARVERNVGVSKGQGVRYVDVLVVEEDVLPGQPPRVETFSMKSIDFTSMTEAEWKAQIQANVDATLEFYDGTLDVRRPSLGLRGQKLKVSKSHLIYDAELKPGGDIDTLREFITEMASKGVEVRFE